MNQTPEADRDAELKAILASSQEAPQPQPDAPASEAPSSRDKFLAIRDAVRLREEAEQQAEEQAEIAARIRRMKSATEDSPYERTVRSEETAPAPPEPKPRPRPETRIEPAKKKKTGKKKSSKKKKRRGPDLFPRKGDSTFEVIRKTVFLLSTTVFIVCMFLIGKYFWENYMNQQKNDIIRNEYHEAEQLEEPDLSDAYEYFTLIPAAARLLEKNPEVVGFITIPTNTRVSYPVLQHTDNDYYLDKDLYGNYEKAGSIFMDYRDYFDRVEDGRRIYDNSQNLIIYGHNMHDYSMFGSLKYYINEANYYNEHPIIELNSNYRRYKYKIFGMIIVDVDDTTETQFDYWNVLNFENETEFYDYVNEVKRRTVRLTDVDVTYGDQLLTLSTCNSTFSQGRLVVFARLLREGEDLMEGCTSTPNPNIKWPNSYYKWHKKTYDPNAEFVPYG